MVAKLNQNNLMQRGIIIILSILLIYVAMLCVDEKTKVIVISQDEIMGTVIENEDGKNIVVSVEDMEFSKVVVNITEHTILGTINGTKIVVNPKHIEGEVLIRFAQIEYMKKDTIYLDAEEILIK